MKIICGTIKGGKVTLEAEGSVGTGCVETTKAYLERLAGREPEVFHKDAYYQTEVHEQQ